MHGHELARTHRGFATMGLVHHRAGQETPRHGHPHACLHIVLRGLYVEHSPAGTVVACPGDVVVKEPELEHWNRFGRSSAESLRFEIEADAWARVDALIPTNAREFERALGHASALRGQRRRTPANGIAPAVELLFRLRRDYRQEVSIAGMARELGVHRSHLTRQFTREFGVSPRAFVAAKRVATAAEAVARGDDRLASIAAGTGFADESHCIRTFRRLFGTTPVRWGQEARRSG